MHIRRQVGLILLGLVLTACGGSKPALREAPQGIGIQTEVVEAGAKPLEQLRYLRAPGLTENLVVEFVLATVLESASVQAGVESPVVTLGLTMGAVNSVAKGVWRYPFAFRVIGVKMPEGATAADTEAATRAVAPLAAVTGAFEVDDRGITRHADVVVPTEITPRLATLLGNIRTTLLSVPLPEEPVGLGARWKVKRLHEAGGIKTTQTVVYSLLEREGRILRLGVTLQQSAAPQQVAFGDGVVLDVEAYEVSGTGRMLVGLDAIAPLGEFRGTSDLRGRLRQGAQVEPLQVTGAVQIVVAPIVGEPAL